MADRTDRKRMRIFLEKIEVKNVGLLEVWVLVYIVAVCLAAPNKSVCILLGSLPVAFYRVFAGITF